MKIVGVDCATTDAKVGLGVGTTSEGGLVIEDATLCSAEQTAVSIIAGWLANRDDPALIAIDAPLGWPKPWLNHSSATTRARRLGRPQTRCSDAPRIGSFGGSLERHRWMLDRIARTAYAALYVRGTLRSLLEREIPLAWTPSDLSTISAIEVYPAATLVAHRLRSHGYKKRANIEERREIVEGLRSKLTIQRSVRDLTSSADLVDAAVCVLAGYDFLSHRAMAPEDRALAEREGWIWVARPEA